MARMVGEVTTEQELTEISRIIEEAKGKLRLARENSGFWEGKAACWEMFACPPEIMGACPAPTYRSVACWEIEGTYGKLSGDEGVGHRAEVCENCLVYKRWGRGAAIRTKLSCNSVNVIEPLVADLSSRDGQVRQSVRRCLESKGSEAVPFLVEALANADQQVRWEAAKALVTIRDPAAARPLVRCLEDRVFEVRWLAAQALIGLRCEALVPLLEAVMNRAGSPWVREGAHHVLHEQVCGSIGAVLRPVVAALERVDAALEAPLAARKALHSLRGSAGRGDFDW